MGMGPPVDEDDEIDFGGGGYVEDGDATTLFTAMSVQPNQARKVLYNDLVTGLKADDNWNAIDALYLIAAHDAQAARLNIKNPATFEITLTSAPVFTTDRGYATDGVDDLLNTNFNPATAGGSFAQNSACFAIWSRTSGQNAGSRAGWFDGTDGITVNPRSATDTATFRINQASLSQSAGNTDGTGFYSANRSLSNATQLYKNGVARTVGTLANQTSTALNSVGLVMGGALAGGFVVTEFAACVIGGSRDAAHQLTLYNRLLAYMQGVGAA